MSLYDLRDELVALMAGAGFTAYPEAPQSFTAPAAVVEPGQPYVTPGNEFGTLTVHFTVNILVNGSPKAWTDLDGFLVQAIPALTGWGNGIDSIDVGPLLITTSNSTFLGAAIAVSGDILTKEMIQ